MKKIYFNIDEFSDTIVVEEIENNRGVNVKKYKRIDYIQFYEALYEIKQYNEKLAEERRLEQIERAKILAQNKKNQTTRVSDILYNDLNLNKPLRGVYAIEDRKAENNDVKYNIFIEINDNFNYAIRKIKTDETYTINGSSHFVNKRCSVDYGSKYIVCLPILNNNGILLGEVKVKKQVKNHNNVSEEIRIPFLEKIIIRNLMGKNLNHLTDIDTFMDVFNTIHSSDLANNELFQQRFDESKQNKTMLVWEGLD